MPRKKDWAEEQTNNLLEDLESRIKREYDTASKEVQKKYDKFVKDFEADDSKMLKSLEEGKISEEAYKKWRAEQMLLNRRWQAMRDTLADDLTMVDKKVLSMTNGYMPEAYSMNFNFATFEVEKGSHVDTSFTLYSRETVEKLMRDDPQLLPKRKMDIPKDKLWNKQHINSAITQGVLQGDSLPQISKRLQQVTDMDARAALRNARTMMTGAQNAGRLDAYTRAENMGIEVLKEWMATLDHHTRESHAKLDGEKVKLSEKFSNGLMFPGDSKGEPHEVYNCRCTMVADVPEYPDDDMKRYDNINGKPIDNVTYAEWAGWKEKTAKNPPIDHRKWIDNVYSSRYSEEDRAEIAQMYSEAPYEVQQFYDKYAQDMNPMDDNGYLKGKAYFQPKDERIHLNGKRDIAGSDYETKFQTSTHEFGHNMDYLAGGKDKYTYLSQWYLDENGKSFEDIIEHDWNECFLNKYNSVKKDVIDLYEQGVRMNIDAQYGFIERFVESTMKMAERSMNIDQSLKETMEEEIKHLNKYGSKEDYVNFFMSHRDVFEDTGYFGYGIKETYSGINSVLIKDFCREIRKEYSLRARGNISDMFERYSLQHGGDDYPFGVGHGKEYALRYGTLAKEAFAEMTDAAVANKESLELIKKFLPNAYNAYIEILKDAIYED